jgi:membrane protein YdbS with pleckstrin-like domain
MYARLTAWLLHWLRVPPEPHPPHGDPASLRVFRAGVKYFYLRLFGWGFGQLVALAGIVFWIVVFVDVEHTVRARHQAQTTPTPAFNADNFAKSMKEAVVSEPTESPPSPQTPTAKPRKKQQIRINGLTGFKQALVEAAMWLPAWSFPLIWVLKILGVLLYLLQIPVTFVVRRLDYELRWYMVTDRSLRIRYGVWNISESTMSFANIQQVVVSQNPVQRLLGLSDVKVQSAGGGGGGEKHEPSSGDDMHLGLFHQVTNGSEIRDLILKRLRRFRESGLGDPDEKAPAVPDEVPPITGDATSLVTAARELAAEARALRQSL